MNYKWQEKMNMANIHIFKNYQTHIFPNRKQHMLHDADCSPSFES